MPQFHSEEEFVNSVQSLISKKLFQHAYAVIEEGLSLYPESSKLKFHSAQLALETLDFINALKILEELNKQDPCQPSTLVLLSRAWSHNGDFDKAIVYLDEAVEFGANKLLMSIIRAEYYERSRKLDLLDECIKHMSKEAVSINIRARALIARKDYVGAIDLLESHYEDGGLSVSDIIHNCFILATHYHNRNIYRNPLQIQLHIYYKNSFLYLIAFYFSFVLKDYYLLLFALRG